MPEPWPERVWRVTVRQHKCKLLLVVRETGLAHELKQPLDSPLGEDLDTRCTLVELVGSVEPVRLLGGRPPTLHTLHPLWHLAVVHYKRVAYVQLQKLVVVEQHRPQLPPEVVEKPQNRIGSFFEACTGPLRTASKEFW